MRRCLPLLIGLAAACQPLTGPDAPERPGTQVPGSPVVAPLDASYVPLVPGDTSFWAVKGEAKTVTLRFRSTQAGQAGDRLVEFRLSAESLYRRPNGILYEEGDSVQITIHPDAQRMVFEFAPSGLVFDAGSPAVLHMWCTHAAADLNGDGRVDATDEQLWYQMRIWKRESDTDPWSLLPTTRSADGYELESALPGFTGFSVAS